MTTIVVDWRELLLVLVGASLGGTGSLYLAYELFDRSEKLYKVAWVCSSGCLFAALLLITYISMVGPDHLASGYVPLTTWRFVGVFSFIAFMMQAVSSSWMLSVRLPGFDRSRFIFWMLLFGLVVGGAIVIVPGTSLMILALFALPGMVASGVLNGFAPAIHWWVLHLPEKRVAGIGALLIGGGFVFLLSVPLLHLLSIPF